MKYTQTTDGNYSITYKASRDGGDLVMEAIINGTTKIPSQPFRVPIKCLREWVKEMEDKRGKVV